MQGAELLELSLQVERWKGEVIRQTSLDQEQLQANSRKRDSRSMSLRSSVKRQRLDNLSANIQRPPPAHLPQDPDLQKGRIEKAKIMYDPKTPSQGPAKGSGGQSARRDQHLHETDGHSKQYIGGRVYEIRSRQDPTRQSGSSNQPAQVTSNASEQSELGARQLRPRPPHAGQVNLLDQATQETGNRGRQNIPRGVQGPHEKETRYTRQESRESGAQPAAPHGHGLQKTQPFRSKQHESSPYYTTEPNQQSGFGRGNMQRSPYATGQPVHGRVGPDDLATAEHQPCGQKSSYQQHSYERAFDDGELGDDNEEPSLGEDDAEFHPGASPAKSVQSGRSRPNNQTKLSHQAAFTPAENFQATDKGSARPGRSPKRSTGQNMAKPFDIAHLSMQHLARCNPPVRLCSYAEARRRTKLPDAVEELWNHLDSVPKNAIPHETRSSYRNDEKMTPRRSRKAPNDHEFSSATQPFRLSDHALLDFKKEIDSILTEARWNEFCQAHERQWGNVASRFLNTIIRLPHVYPCRLLNIENCSINPVQMRPTLNEGKGGTKPLIHDVKSNEVSETPAEREERALSKMIDWGVALALEDDDLKSVELCFGEYEYHLECTLTQCTTYIDKCPIFIDIEMKKASVPDPKIQLAVWKQAALKKRQHHGWDTKVPMPGITVEKHEWNCYLFFKSQNNLIMLGPQKLGGTNDRGSIWELARKLNILIDWGTKEYRSWLYTSVLNQPERGKQAARASRPPLPKRLPLIGEIRGYDWEREGEGACWTGCNKPSLKDKK
ncbi:uncharacterized protein KY384_002890 [Bacidia gigantensis]|uniref:uncharacterized protein n=1 Tax=Bacidia gigantensis TaxID=2732470 RepID=UPI001D05AB75|nr:uncharacterized protein KY384_002890 [Bacidia gigantensis]KAG8532405.1 hypothetical protein KY384_002890 [Bacidia gigantensis]